MADPSSGLRAYYAAGKALVCELDLSPYVCEFWPEEELTTYNLEYEVPLYAHGYFGFATSGGGEMFALSPSGAVVILPFIGMAPDVAVQISPSWVEFERLLRAVP
jgi:hypothetical protein